MTVSVIDTGANTRRYFLNEIFCSVQGEGIRAGTLNHFIRFAGCNMRCDVEPGPLSPGGFACDTEFESARPWVMDEIIGELKTLNGNCQNVILTGGEPLLQVDRKFIEGLKLAGYYVAVETNGSMGLPEGVRFQFLWGGIDWITCSPKVAEHAVKLEWASEVKYVRGYGQGIPKPACKSEYKLLSPAFNGNEPDHRAVDWCLKLIQENPTWRLTLQLHKFIQVR